MLRNISFFIKLLLLKLLLMNNSKETELSIIPLKKPILDQKVKEKKLAQGIIKPKPKPSEKIEKQKLLEKIIEPETKPSQQY